MHLLGDDQKRGRKNRTDAEKFFKRFNTVLLVLQLACYLVVISQVSINQRKTFSGDFWFPKDFKLQTLIEQKTMNCTWNTQFKVLDFTTVNLTINYRNQGRMMANTAWEMRLAMLLYGAALILGAINKLLFDFNIYYFEYRYLRIHKELLSAAELTIVGFCLKQNIEMDPQAALIRDYLKHCGIEAQSSIYHAAPFIPLYIGISFVLFGHFCSTLIYLKNTLKTSGLPNKVEQEKQQELEARREAAQYYLAEEDIVDPTDAQLEAGATNTPYEGEQGVYPAGQQEEMPGEDSNNTGEGVVQGEQDVQPLN